ncbi:hypothetical protein L593_07570 [Salinarchaeum sp. Harcht-Bsk1]|uniref:DUF2085 domain-containing protein n=1 Tax=Salinarchaeum sp. Harcht-Bsk1 TaxID=1333523 RepID=UPI000342320E|nr:DUF2085 domain-containing protein [Salinarchaeum sp. Harcht-Bsk1]AGN01459.1 hypothetical protein L593_07570 [Salinarchaeum sp. Harcht-Bsk1]
MVDWAELRAGLAETRMYLLSHHEPSDYDRTYAVTVLGRRERLCARCTGIYPGIAAGLLARGLGVGPLTEVWLLLVLPLPALLDWTVTRVGDRSGSNSVRTATGALLGYAYGVGLVALFLDGDLRVSAIGAGYGLLAGALLWRRERSAP